MNAVGRSTLIISFSLLSAACGRKGPLLYPDMLVPASPAAVTAQQSGSSVKLQFTLPDKDQAGRPITGLSGVKISRMASETGQKDVCRSCLADYLLLRTLYLDHLPTDTQRFGSRLIMIDSDVKAGNSYSYRVIPFTADCVDGASSATAAALVDAPAPAPAVRIESFPTEVRLQITSEILNGSHIGFNVYRSAGAEARPYQPLNREPFQEKTYVDGTLSRGIRYRYVVRELIKQKSGDVVESVESQEVAGVLKDDE
jgi:predicted small lipoprotein YifL